ncbi:MAG: aminotransferase class IV [Gammaproteobacteria bacterium]|nr:aminotransferase class IV [Gammaproteobacteria bacterium]
MKGFESMANVDGVISRIADAQIPVMDRGFLYGDSIYEVFRTYGGVPLFYDEHWARFENSASLIHMQLGLTKKQMTQEIRQTVLMTNAAERGRDVYVRYIMTRGEGPVDLYPNPELVARYVIIVDELREWRAEFYSQGVRLAIPEVLRNPSSALDPNIKGGNYLNNILGIIQARALGADDCVMLNDAGLVTESSNSNVFFVIDDKIVTPAETAGNLRGLTKVAVLEACREQGVPTKERDIAVDELVEATECFITSATREVMPVIGLRLLDGKQLDFPEGGGRQTRRVAECYKARLQAYVDDHAALSIF